MLAEFVDEVMQKKVQKAEIRFASASGSRSSVGVESDGDMVLRERERVCFWGGALPLAECSYMAMASGQFQVLARGLRTVMTSLEGGRSDVGGRGRGIRGRSGRWILLIAHELELPSSAMAIPQRCCCEEQDSG